MIFTNEAIKCKLETGREVSKIVHMKSPAGAVLKSNLDGKGSFLDPPIAHPSQVNDSHVHRLDFKLLVTLLRLQ